MNYNDVKNLNQEKFNKEGCSAFYLNLHSISWLYFEKAFYVQLEPHNGGCTGYTVLQIFDTWCLKEIYRKLW